MSRVIKAILFDLGNVIVGVDAHKLERVYSGDGRVVKEGEVVDYFNNSANINLYMEGKLDSSRFYTRTKKIFKLKMKFGEFYQHWNDIFFPIRQTEKIIKNLKAEYPLIKLVLVSNTNETHYDFIKGEYGILELLDGHIVSHEFGKQKPHPDIFKEAMKMAGTLPKETLYTDDRQDLIDAARVMGIHAFQFTTPEQFRSDLSKFDINV